MGKLVVGVRTGVVEGDVGVHALGLLILFEKSNAGSAHLGESAEGVGGQLHFLVVEADIASKSLTDT